MSAPPDVFERLERLGATVIANCVARWPVDGVELVFVRRVMDDGTCHYSVLTALRRAARDDDDALAALPAVLVRAASRLDRLTKLLRLTVQPRLGDPAFDAKVFVDTELPTPDVRRLLASPALRAAMVELLAQGAPELRGNDDCCELSLSWKTGEWITSGRADLQVIGRAYATIARELPPIRAFGPRPRSRVPAGLITLGASVALVAATVVPARAYVTLDASLQPKLAVAATAGVLTIAIAWRWIRLRRRASLLFALAVLVVAPIAAVCATAAVDLINGELDDAPAATPALAAHTYAGVGARVGRRSYYVELAAVPPLRAPVTVEVPAWVHERLRGRRDVPITILTGEGRLGLRWMPARGGVVDVGVVDVSGGGAPSRAAVGDGRRAAIVGVEVPGLVE